MTMAVALGIFCAVYFGIGAVGSLEKKDYKKRVLARQTGAVNTLRLSTRTVDDVVVVDCSGRIVRGDEATLLRDTVKKLLTGNNRIVLDLSGVNYIDSGGLGTLLALYTSARKTPGGSIKLANLTGR